MASSSLVSVFHILHAVRMSAKPAGTVIAVAVTLLLHQRSTALVPTYLLLMMNLRHCETKVSTHI